MPPARKPRTGLPQWTRAFGYLGDTRQPDPHTAPLVKQAYAAILAGSSLERHLPGCGMTPARDGLNGKPWTNPVSHVSAQAAQRRVARPQPRDVGKGTWPPWWTNRLGGQRNPCSTHPGGHRAARRVRRHLLTGVLRLRQTRCGGYMSGSGPTTKPNRLHLQDVSQCGIRAEHVEPLASSPCHRAAGQTRRRRLAARPNCTTRPRPRRCAFRIYSQRVAF